jgi:hypothetical protein
VISIIRKNSNYLLWLLVLATLCSCIWLRTVGQDWDRGQGLHPDERFILMVSGSIKTVNSLAQYFDTANSSMNPHNNNFGFYVYGNLPLNVIRLLADVYKDVPLDILVRSISAIFDVSTGILIFILSWRLFGRWSALLAFALYSFSVLPIQLSHYGTFDIHGTFFCTLVMLVAYWLQTVCKKAEKINLVPTLVIVALGGICAAAAAATKINLLAAYGLIPLAMLIGFYRQGPAKAIALSIVISIFGLLFLILGFRFFQPIAFEGPAFWNFAPNSKWISNIKELLSQAKPSTGFPPAVQWIDRSRIHSFTNMITWGLGLPLGIFSLVAWFFCAYRIIKHKQSELILLVVWAFVGTILFSIMPLAQPMRYSIVVFPALVMLSAYLAKFLVSEPQPWLVSYWNVRERLVARICVASVLVLTATWAFAFTNIYRQTNTRIAASEWILNNIPAALNFVKLDDSLELVPVAGVQKSLSLPNKIDFVPSESFRARSMLVPKLSMDSAKTRLNVSISLNQGKELANLNVDASQGEHRIAFSPPLEFKAGQNYKIELKNSDPVNSSAKVSLNKVELSNETSWDDSLPQRINGKDPYGGIYAGELNLEIYWQDQQLKVERIANVLSQADYFYLSSNRQVATVGRLPKVFPVAAIFYQRLLGCSRREYIPACYAEVKRGERQGDLGFELIQTFESYPTIFGFELNTQLADESFQVYDHPKVLLFKNVNRLSAAELQKKLTPVRMSLESTLD